MKHSKFSWRLEAPKDEIDFYKIRLNAFLFVLKHISYEEENKLKNSLAVYICLEYSEGAGPGNRTFDF